MGVIQRVCPGAADVDALLGSARTRRMDHASAQALADGYIAYMTAGDTSVLTMLSPDFHDNVSKTHGLEIFDVVSRWLDESFADRSAEGLVVEHWAVRDDAAMLDAVKA